jgi:hypothetical protein
LDYRRLHSESEWLAKVLETKSARFYGRGSSQMKATLPRPSTGNAVSTGQKKKAESC